MQLRLRAILLPERTPSDITGFIDVLESLSTSVAKLIIGNLLKEPTAARRFARASSALHGIVGADDIYQCLVTTTRGVAEADNATELQ